MIAVTGGAGFIGSCLVHHLNSKGIREIVIVDHLDHGPKWNNLVGASFVDYVDREVFLKSLINKTQAHNFETIFHLGACSQTTQKDSDYLMNNNTLYSRTLAKWCLNNNVKLIYASSAATYGNGENGYDDHIENLDHLRPLNMYGYSKHLFDLWARNNGWLDKITGFKFFNVFGPRESHKQEMCSLVFKAFPEVMSGKTMHLFRSHKPQYADGEQMRDFIYIDDVVKVLAWALDHPKVSGLFNLGRGEAVSWNRLAQDLFSACEQPQKIEYFDMPENIRHQYQYHTCANMERLRSAGYQEPFMDFSQSVQHYVNWLKDWSSCVRHS